MTTQRALHSCAIRDILAVPRGSPQALTSPIGSPPDFLALPIALGGFAFPLFVARKLQRQGGVEQTRIGPAIYIPCLEGFLAAAMSDNPQLVQAAIVLARLAGWKLAVWNAPDDPAPPRPRYRPPARHHRPYSASPISKETTAATTRAIALAARAMSEADATIIARADRGPYLLEFGGRRATKAAILAQATCPPRTWPCSNSFETTTPKAFHTPTSAPPSPPSRTDVSMNHQRSTPSNSDSARACGSASPTSTPTASPAVPTAAATLRALRHPRDPRTHVRRM